MNIDTDKYNRKQDKLVIEIFRIIEKRLNTFEDNLNEISSIKQSITENILPLVNKHEDILYPNKQCNGIIFDIELLKQKVKQITAIWVFVFSLVFQALLHFFKKIF